MQNILNIKDLKKSFKIQSSYFFSKKTDIIKAVNGVSFGVKKGEFFGLVGESGCGKTTTGRIIAGLLRADKGLIDFKGVDLIKNHLSYKSPFRKDIQMIFQDPLSSLNPRMRIFDIISEPLVIHGNLNKKEINNRVEKSLIEVSLKVGFKERYPHQLSGGQRQRVLIARSLILSPDFIVADEPVSALDVSVQAQILNLMKHLQEKKGFSSIFISHDLAVVRYICAMTAVMYLGKIVEIGPSRELFNEPLHPYTKSLKDSSPDIKIKNIKKIMRGNIPNPINPPAGCVFHPRCRHVRNICKEESPILKKVGVDRKVACHFA